MSPRRGAGVWPIRSPWKGDRPARVSRVRIPFSPPTNERVTMSILQILFTVLIIGVIVYGVKRWAPVDETFKNIFYVIAIVATLIWLYRDLIVAHHLLPW